MKKLMYLLVAGFLFTFTACGGGETATEQTASDVVPADVAAEQTASDPVVEEVVEDTTATEEVEATE